MPPLLCTSGSEEVTNKKYLPSGVSELSGLQKPTSDEAACLGARAKLSARCIMDISLYNGYFPSSAALISSHSAVSVVFEGDFPARLYQ